MSKLKAPLEAREKYLHRRQDEIEKLLHSCESSVDWELAQKVGHQIKGNAVTFDFPL